MTQLPIDELASLKLTGSRSREASPRYNEKVVALVRTDQQHIRVFFNRCLGSQHLHGLRLVDLEWTGYLWRVANATFIPTPQVTESAKGIHAEGLIR